MKFIDSILKVIILLPALAGSGCIYDDYSNCGQDVVFRLSYVLNKDYQDKFDHQVESVDLLIYDAEGAVMRQMRYNNATNEITLRDLPRGEYKAVFWANYTDAFALDAEAALDSHVLILKCDTNGEIRNFDGSLFHSYTTFQIQTGLNTVRVPLVKNTNKVTVKLVGNAAKPVTDDYHVTVSGSNAAYKYDNSPVAPQPAIIYHPIAHAGNSDERTYTLNVMRLLFGDDLQVNIFKGTTLVRRIPLVATLAENSPLLQTDTDLNRYDEYELMYVLNADDTFTLTFIRINDWQKVIQNGGLS